MLISLTIAGLLIFIFFIIRHLSLVKLVNTPMDTDHEKIVTLTDTNFYHYIKDKTMLVDFWASWCRPCRVMAPVLNEVAAELEENHRVGKVDVERNHSLAERYKVRNIPTLILFKNGEEINRFVGIKSKEYLLKEIARPKQNTIN